MEIRSNLTEDELSALAVGPSAAVAAMMTTGHPGFLGVIKETRAGLAAIKSKAPTDPPAADLVRTLIAYAEEHKDISRALQTEETDPAAMRETAFQALDRAALAAMKLSSEERDGYVGWLVGVARSVAEAASEAGDEGPVSTAEATTLAEISRRLEGG